MKPVRLGFPSTSRVLPSWLTGRSTPTGVVLGLTALAISLGFLAATSWDAWSIKTQLAAVQAELQVVRAAQGRDNTKSLNTKPPVSAQQKLAWNQIARQLNTPWSALLDALESATPDEVAAVSIEPDGRQGSVRLQVEAKTLDILLAYAGSLKAVELFDQVSLIKHETNEQDTTKPLRLSLDIRLKDKGPAR